MASLQPSVMFPVTMAAFLVQFINYYSHYYQYYKFQMLSLGSPKVETLRLEQSGLGLFPQAALELPLVGRESQ